MDCTASEQAIDVDGILVPDTARCSWMRSPCTSPGVSAVPGTASTVTALYWAGLPSR